MLCRKRDTRGCTWEPKQNRSMELACGICVPGLRVPSKYSYTPHTLSIPSVTGWTHIRGTPSPLWRGHLSHVPLLKVEVFLRLSKHVINIEKCYPSYWKIITIWVRPHLTQRGRLVCGKYIRRTHQWEVQHRQDKLWVSSTWRVGGGRIFIQGKTMGSLAGKLNSWRIHHMGSLLRNQYIWSTSQITRAQLKRGLPWIMGLLDEFGR